MYDPKPYETLPRARAQGRTRGEGARAHAETGAERRRNGLKRAAAARAEFEPSVGAGKMGAKPMTASGTVLVDALHGPAGKILHKFVLRWPPSPVRGSPWAAR